MTIKRTDYFNFLFAGGRGIRTDQVDWSVADPDLVALVANLTGMAVPTPLSRWTLVTLDDAPPPSAADVLANGTESALDREILVTNPGHNGYFWVYSSTPINYFGPAETGNNQFDLLVTRPDVVLNGTTYHVWRLYDIQAAFTFNLTWYAYES